MEMESKSRAFVQLRLESNIALVTSHNSLANIQAKTDSLFVMLLTSTQFSKHLEELHLINLSYSNASVRD